MANKKSKGPDPENLYVLWDKTANRAIKWDVKESERSLVGLDSNLEYYEMHENRMPRNPDGTLQVDTVYYTVKELDGVLDTGVNPPVWRVAEEVNNRPEAEIIELLKNVRRLKAHAHIAPNDAIDRQGRAMYAVIKSLRGVTLAPRETAELDQYLVDGAALWENDAQLKGKLTSLAAGQKPDPQSGYKPEGPIK